MTRNFSPVSLGAFSFLLALTHNASAGQWVVDHYENNGLFQSQLLWTSGERDEGAPLTTSIKKHEYRVLWTPEGEKDYSDGEVARSPLGMDLSGGFNLVAQRNSYYPDGCFNNQQSVVTGSIPGTAKANYSMRAVLRWQRGK